MNKVILLVKSPVFSRTVFYIIFFITCLAFSTRNDVIDVDFWSRLIMGQHVFETGRVMKTDIVSFAPTHTWFDHEWLSSTFFYILHKYTGTAVLNIFKAILMFCVFLAIDLNIQQTQKEIDYKYKYVYFFTAAGIFFHIALFDKVRCQFVTYLFIPLLLYLLERVRSNPKSKAMWLIPLLMLIWLNSHGGALMAQGIILLYAIGEAITKRPSKSFFIAFFISALMWFINPWGAEFIPFMLKAIGLDRQWIGEWQSPLTLKLDQRIIYLSILVFISAAYIYSLIRRKVKLKDIHYGKLFLLIILTVLTLRYIKQTSIYFISVFALMYGDFRVILDDIESLVKKVIKFNFVLYPFVMLGFLAYSIYVFCNFSISDTYYENTVADMPVRPLQFLRSNNIAGKIYAPYHLSGYIARREYPRLKIFMDGRQEQVWDFSVFKESMDFLYFESDDAKILLEKYKPDIILLDGIWGATDYMMRRQNHYELIFDDGTYKIFVDPKIKKFRYKYPPGIHDYTQYNLFDTELNFKKDKNKSH